MSKIVSCPLYLWISVLHVAFKCFKKSILDSFDRRFVLQGLPHVRVEEHDQGQQDVEHAVHGSVRVTAGAVKVDLTI